MKRKLHRDKKNWKCIYILKTRFTFHFLIWMQVMTELKFQVSFQISPNPFHSPRVIEHRHHKISKILNKTQRMSLFAVSQAIAGAWGKCLIRGGKSMFDQAAGNSLFWLQDLFCSLRDEIVFRSYTRLGKLWALSTEVNYEANVCTLFSSIIYQLYQYWRHVYS